jgi:hypothetical protein
MSKDRFTRGWDGSRRKVKRMGTLWGDPETGEGDVSLSLDGMCDEDALLRLDVLQDWIGLLQREYDITLTEWEREVRRLVKRKAKEKNALSN